MAFVFRQVFVAFVLALSCAGPAAAQDAKELLRELMGRQAAVASVQELERFAARVIHIDSLALLSELSGWPEKRPEWEESWPASSWVYDVHNLETRFLTELADLRRKGARAGFTEEQRARFDDAADMLAALISQSSTYYDLILRGRLDAASSFFRDEIRTTYMGITVAGYTVTSEINRDISRISLKMRMLD